MFPLGHVGIGVHLVPRRLREGLPWRWLAFGCLLPDVIDKPIWLAARWMGVRSDLFDMAKMVGHTAFFALALAVAALLMGSRSRQIVALAFAVPTHLVLDILADAGMGFGFGVWKSWLFWPLELPDLNILMAAASPLRDLSSEVQSPAYLAGEVVGGALLVWDWLRNRSKPF